LTIRNKWKEVRAISKKPAVHTVPYGDGWASITEGATRHFGVRPTKDAAERVGRESARDRGVEHMSHRRDGTIGERRSYGPDPYPPKG
jgi:hypothetical protein